jgi:ribulose-5-phosphate 4-epimerase/fuculose-1-phosphate aldolase
MPEQYVGIKFATVFLRGEPTSDPRAAELLDWCRRWAAAGWIGKAMGNLSCRSAAGFIITPTGSDPQTLQPWRRQP